MEQHSFQEDKFIITLFLSNTMPNPHQGGVTDGTSTFSNNRKLCTAIV